MSNESKDISADPVDVIIFGAGPAGLAAAVKLVKNGKKVIVFEKEDQVGGISKTKEYHNYRFDLGGHRFFTKSREVNELWEETLGGEFLVRPRLSRIFYRNRFFDYPIKPVNALKGLGLSESFLILGSYVKAKLLPQKEEKNFQQWVSNRFGQRLFDHFFKSYTEKLWGIPCDEIQAEWAAQRIKGLSMTSALKNAMFPDKSGKIKTLIEEFKYPKYGPGMMYEKMAENAEKMGCVILKETKVVSLRHNGTKVDSVIVKDRSGAEKEYTAGAYLSSMPLTGLVQKMNPAPSNDALDAARNLSYRSFLTVSVILKGENPFPDTWIYIHSPEVKMGRIQNFKNWSPFMVPDENHIALGLEYFATEGDELWQMRDEDLIDLALTELEKIHLGRKDNFQAGFVIRVPKAYPVYDSTYPGNIQKVKEYLGKFENLQPIGRYGMFKYNNMDHSILTGLYAAENLLGGHHDVWDVNADQEYHEESKTG